MLRQAHAVAQEGQRGVAGPGGGADPNRAGFQKALDALTSDGSLSATRNFETADAAATEVLGLTAPLSKKFGLEISGNIYKGKDGYRYTLPVIGEATTASLNPNYIGYHTHIGGRLLFSNSFTHPRGPNDIAWINASGRALYMGVQLSTHVGITVCDLSCSGVGQFGSAGRVLQ